MRANSCRSSKDSITRPSQLTSWLVLQIGLMRADYGYHPDRHPDEDAGALHSASIRVLVSKDTGGIIASPVHGADDDL